MAIPPPQPGSAALVTGASAGIGREFSRLLAEQGHTIVMTARNQGRLEAAADAIRADTGATVEPIACDVGDPAARTALFEQLEAKHLTIATAVLCAGVGSGGHFVDHDADRVLEIVRTNVEGVVTLAHALAPPMIERRSGAILIVSSAAGNQPMPNFGLYSATKAGLNSFAEMLHEEVRTSGVTVTLLTPGFVTTDFAVAANMVDAADRLPDRLKIDPLTVARAGLEGLARGDRRVGVPAAGVRALRFVSKHTPDGLWLRVAQRMMASAR